MLKPGQTYTTAELKINFIPPYSSKAGSYVAKAKLKAKAELQRIADAERRTLSQLVAIIIEDFLKERAEKGGS